MKQAPTVPKRSSYWVPMVGNAIRVIEAFYTSGVELTLHDVSSRAGVSKTSALRILHTLGELGYVDRNPGSSKYQLGVKFVEVAHRASSGRNLIQIVRPFMNQLRVQFDETVNFAVLRNQEIVYMEIVESHQSFRMVAQVGARVPMHATALGKAIAAFLPDTVVRGTLSATGMQPYTSRTITTMEKFERALEQVRRSGYSVDNEEAEMGALCIAAPLLNADRQAIAAISVSGPVHRMKTQQRAIIQQLRKATTTISRSLASFNSR